MKLFCGNCINLGVKTAREQFDRGVQAEREKNNLDVGEAYRKGVEQGRHSERKWIIEWLKDDCEKLSSELESMPSDMRIASLRDGNICKKCNVIFCKCLKKKLEHK